MTASANSTLDRRTLDLIFLIGTLLILLGLARNLLEGGHAWQQGDWLINSIEVQVRRGPFGSGLIRLSDLLGTDLIWTVGAVQALLVLATMGGFWTALRGRDIPTHVALLLIASPCFLIFFWPANPRGALRKELLVYAAFALLLVGLPRRQSGLVAASVVLMSLAVVAHEALILFLPCYLICMALARPAGAPLSNIAITGLGVCAGAALAFIYAWQNRGVAEIGPICAPLLERGVDREICRGAIFWLQFGMGNGWEIVRDIIVARGRLPVMGLAWLMSLVPLAYMISRSDRPWLWAGVILLAALPFIPLFFIAIDWGRWLNYHVMCATSLILAALQSGRMGLIRPFNRRYVWLLVILAGLWTPNHVATVFPGGATLRLISELTPLEYHSP